MNYMTKWFSWKQRRRLVFSDKLHIIVIMYALNHRLGIF